MLLYSFLNEVNCVDEMRCSGAHKKLFGGAENQTLFFPSSPHGTLLKLCEQHTGMCPKALSCRNWAWGSKKRLWPRACFLFQYSREIPLWILPDTCQQQESATPFQILFLKECKCFVQTHSQLSVHSQVWGALKICQSPWKSFSFLLDKTCCLLFYLNWKITRAKWYIIDGTTVPTVLVLAVQLICMGQFSPIGVSSLWSRQAQKWVNCSSFSGHQLQISSARMEVHLLHTTTCFSFT